MKYMGSKARTANKMLPIILEGRLPTQTYVEPFAGGMNMMDKVGGNRIANDIHCELIAMWKHLVYKEWKPPYFSKVEYNEIRRNKSMFDNHVVGWVGFACSYSGKYFAGFAGDYPAHRRMKNGKLPNYQTESINSVAKQVSKLKGVQFTCKPFWDLQIPENSIIYCDPPYANTTKYKHNFDHAKFWQWCRQMSCDGHKVFVSEYEAPSDFVCVWEHTVGSQLSANGKYGGTKHSVERLFTLKHK